VSVTAHIDESGASYAPFTFFQALVMATYLIVLYTCDPLLPHGTVVSHPVFREFTLFLDQYIEHQPRHGEAEENDDYDQDL